jgi:hypothetical protein
LKLTFKKKKKQKSKEHGEKKKKTRAAPINFGAIGSFGHHDAWSFLDKRHDSTL